jgi:hypothetical protein
MTQRRIIGAGQRRVEILVATLFLVTAAASIPAALLGDPILNAPHYLAEIFPNTAAVAWVALLWSINNIGIVFIAVYMYPLLRKLNETAAVGYLALRIIEGAVMMFGIAATLMLIPLSGEFIKAGAPLNSWYQTLGNSLKQAMLMGLTQISLPILGLVGYTLILFGGAASWFSVIDPTPFGPATYIAIPVALFEIILLPFWLFFRGFKMPAVDSEKK